MPKNWGYRTGGYNPGAWSSKQSTRPMPSGFERGGKARDIYLSHEVNRKYLGRLRQKRNEAVRRGYSAAEYAKSGQAERAAFAARSAVSEARAYKKERDKLAKKGIVRATGLGGRSGGHWQTPLTHAHSGGGVTGWDESKHPRNADGEFTNK